MPGPMLAGIPLQPGLVPNIVALDTDACPLCPQPKMDKKKYCFMHQRAHEAMERDAKIQEKKGMVRAVKSFQGLHGDDAAYGDLVVAYCKKFPQGDVKKGKKRGSLDWVQIQKRLAMITYTDVGIKVKLLDRTEYSSKMKAKWEWFKPRAWEEWGKMVVNPSNIKQEDHVGASGELEMHIWVPLGKSARVGSKSEEIHEIFLAPSQRSQWPRTTCRSHLRS